MIKVVSLLKRHPDLTMEQFVSYYEETHVKIGEQLLKGKAVRYVRRYLCAIPPSSELACDEQGADFLTNLPSLPTGGTTDADFDVITEIWYESIDQWHSALVGLKEAAVATSVAKDEARFIDRGRRRHYIVMEHESNLG